MNPNSVGSSAVGRAACPICGVPQRLSDEDILPTWARNHVILLGSYGPREQRPRRIKMRICAICNSKLGQIFEHRGSALMKPMLHGSAVSLDRKDQLHISCWIVKTSLLITLIGLEQGDTDRALALDIIRKLMTERIPPIQTLIRIFKRDIEEEMPIVDPAPAASMQAPPTAFFSITSVGYFGWEMAIGPYWPILQYQSNILSKPGFLQIWPPEAREIQWPPSTIVKTREIETLRAAYIASSKPDRSQPIIRRWGGKDTNN